LRNRKSIQSILIEKDASGPPPDFTYFFMATSQIAATAQSVKTERTMDRRSACLATAELYRQQAEMEPHRRAFLLAEAMRWVERAETKLQLSIQIEGRTPQDAVESDRRAA
jgi:hypothetical protein